ncbi:MAG: DUF5677 domain-containing protein [Dehalococcoidales bacterium]|jgi:hypothetical protein
METEFKQLLDRKKNIDDVNTYFHDHIDILIDMVNYGSWLIPRAYDSSKKDMEAAIVIGVLLKQVITMIDSVEIQISNASIFPAFLQSRAAFEASLYIDWIIKEESGKKANYYYVFNLLDQRKWALRLIKGTAQQQKFQNDIKELIIFSKLDFDKDKELANKQLEEINKILNQPVFKQIYEQFEVIYKKGKREPNWYTPILQNGSLGIIARAVGRYPQYLFYYDKGSKVMHSSSYTDHIKFSKKDNKIIFEPIRYLNDIDYLFRYSMQMIVHTYSSIIKKYRAGEVNNYIKKYTKDWRNYCLNIPGVNYKSA